MGLPKKDTEVELANGRLGFGDDGDSSSDDSPDDDSEEECLRGELAAKRANLNALAEVMRGKGA